MGYENKEVQEYLCNHSGFNDVSGKICINNIPQLIQNKIKQDISILKQIQHKHKTKGSLYWSYPKNDKEEVEIPDPLTHVIGFYTVTQEKQKTLKSFVLKSFRYTPNIKIFEHVLKSRGYKQSTDTEYRPLSVTENRNTKRVNESFIARNNLNKQINLSNDHGRGKSVDKKVVDVIQNNIFINTTEAHRYLRNAKQLRMSMVLKGNKTRGDSMCSVTRRYK